MAELLHVDASIRDFFLVNLTIDQYKNTTLIQVQLNDPATFLRCGCFGQIKKPKAPKMERRLKLLSNNEKADFRFESILNVNDLQSTLHQSAYPKVVGPNESSDGEVFQGDLLELVQEADIHERAAENGCFSSDFFLVNLPIVDTRFLMKLVNSRTLSSLSTQLDLPLSEIGYEDSKMGLPKNQQFYVD
ncbi:hypothetical protein V6N11_041001 [Hibiscus sabdariffa]|uniref:Uncharacterized protein n=1 Tax=Hibiscus sabdariffa TaxID=183260 RepID=A0ABR2RJ74_9ROSI